MESLIVHTTFLELHSRAAFMPAFVDNPDLRVLVARPPATAVLRWLYTAVGWAVQWDSRAAWTEETWMARLAHPSVTALVLFQRGVPIGFVELDAAASEPGTEITHLGLLPTHQGHGLGKHLLSVGVARAFAAGATRIWLHTDNFDGLHALANYQARGFTVYRVTTHEEPSYPPGQAPAPPAEALVQPPLPLDGFAPVIGNRP